MEICPDISEQLNCINRQTALHIAVESGKDKVVQYLLTIFGSEGLINKQDTDGNTLLHLAAIIEDYLILEILLKGKRVYANLVNMDGLTALDIIQSSTELDIFQKKDIISRLKRAGGLPNLKQQLVGTKIGIEQPMQTMRGLKSQEDKEDGSGNPKDQRDRRVRKRKSIAITQFLSPIVVKNASNNDILIATIIATVTSAAAFQAPGGYESDGPHQGLPLFRNKPQFNSFIICDCLALGLSSSSIFLHFLASIGNGDSTSAGNYVLRSALLSTFYSTLAMVGAFISAVYLLSENSWGLKIAAYVCGCGFFCGYLDVSIGRWALWKIFKVRLALSSY